MMSYRHSEEFKNLGLNISFYRKKRGFSQIKLAEMLNISRTHMSRIETADCAMSLELLFDICQCLGIEAKQLFDFK